MTAQAPFSLHPDQQLAVSLATDPARRICVIAGSPGTGKTTAVRAIVEHFERAAVRVSLAAPTGKAAVRMRQQTGRPASTIHRLLEPTPPTMAFARCAAHPLDAEVVVLDEVSMVDVRLMRDLVVALKPTARLVLVGDIYQLPAVGPGNVLGDLIASGLVPTVHLTTIKRQNPGPLLRAIHEIKDGRTPAVLNGRGDDIFFDDRPTIASNPEAIARSVLELVLERLPKMVEAKRGAAEAAGEPAAASPRPLDALRDVQVITAMRSQGPLSCEALNKLFQERLHPPQPGAPAADDKRRFKVGDKVIQTKNDYELRVFNGDIGFVRAYDRDERDRPIIRVAFEPIDAGAPVDSRIVEIPAGENDLALAYAVTVHKYQGSEARVIVIPLHSSQAPRLLTRNWMYTAVSRARELCVLVGSREVLAKAVRRTAATRRLTSLADMVRRGHAYAQRKGGAA